MSNFEIKDLSQFNTKQILDCGQIFRYLVVDKEAIVVSTNKFAHLKTENNKIIVTTNDDSYFNYFFDLDTDYNLIKQSLKKDKFLRPCCEFGYGIRLLKQNLFEMIISFIISANNNIKRIKNSVNYLAKHFGDKIYLTNDYFKFLNLEKNNLIEQEDNKYFYYAFPSLKQLKRAGVKDFVEAGLGYRAQQMYETVQTLEQNELDKFYNYNLEEQKKFLLSLKGVGEKVANCILLFTGLNMKSFPVDTWINKVYNSLNNKTETNRSLIEKELTARYKDLSGYAQQYFFYYYRENKLN